VDHIGWHIVNNVLKLGDYPHAHNSIMLVPGSSCRGKPDSPPRRQSCFLYSGTWWQMAIQDAQDICVKANLAVE
jgi:hypothetical protein